MRNSNFSLKQYSTFALSFILIKNANAEVEYTDIEPDFSIDSNFESEGIDMDNDGNFDFAFINFSITIDSIIYSLRQHIFAGAYGTSANEVAGFYNIYYFPYALNSGNLINSSLSFQNYGFQKMAWKIFISFDTASGGIWSGTGSGGEWFPEVLDHYLGVHFLDAESKYHYGWIRCDVKDEGRTLVIKDYAYEKFIDREIIAGDTIGYHPFEHDTIVLNPGTGIENVLTVAQVYSFEQSIYIQLAIIIPKAQVIVYDLVGKEIYTAELNNLSTVIPINALKGIYLVEITADESRFTKKVYLN